MPAFDPLPHPFLKAYHAVLGVRQIPLHALFQTLLICFLPKSPWIRPSPLEGKSHVAPNIHWVFSNVAIPQASLS